MEPMSSDETLNMSVLKVDTVDQLTSPAFGPIGFRRFERGPPKSSCPTCVKHTTDRGSHCLGHFGHIDIGKTVVQPILRSDFLKFIKEICPICLRKYDQPKERKIGVVIAEELEVLRWYIQEYIQGRVETWEIDCCGCSCYLGLSNNGDILSYGSLSISFEMLTILHKMLLKDSSSFSSLLCRLLPVPPSSVRTLGSKDLPMDDLNKAYEDLCERALSEGRRESNMSYYLFTISDKILELTKRKEGLFRAAIFGKRVDRSCRGVITGDPSLHPDQVGIPKVMSKSLRRVVQVTRENQSQIFIWLNQGILSRTLEDLEEDESLLQVEVDPFEVVFGMRFERDLIDDDLVLFNRQPSLSALSLMTFKAKIKNKGDDTISLNPLLTSAFNADFDGDEMNLFVTDFPEARLDMERMTPTACLGPKLDGRRSVQPIQDSVTISYILADCDQVDPRLSMDAITSIDLFRRERGLKVVYRKIPSTGKELLSLCFPLFRPYQCDTMDRFSIGNIIDEIAQTSKEEALAFCQSLQIVSILWCERNSLSVSSQDMEKMIQSGARGSSRNLSQMFQSVGQQYVGGQEPSESLCISATVRSKPLGMCTRSYLGGLDPEEFFYHQMAARVNIANVSVGTASSGYTGNMMRKMMSDVREEKGLYLLHGRHVVKF